MKKSLILWLFWLVLLQPAAFAEKRYIYTNAEGGVSIVVPVSLAELRKSNPEITAENYEQFIISRSIPAGTPYEIVEDSEIPTDRTYRNAWKRVGKTVTCDMEKAKAIHLKRIRAAIKARMEETDDPEEIETLKAASKVDLSKINTIEALKEAWPEALQNRGIHNE